ncbi:MAG: SDR family NAD(P)-dependent oxidoreductase, partial [Alphaproteobacteria bacterium]|nr:SDR family NAD(P)-dependent oxidoreductase [Alphaproteobacteria bacterium]
MTTISFEGRVAIVTGAGGGLGRAYALELARRGAKVVVNDLGGARDGTGHSDAAAKVVAEIEAAGGTAMANGASVTALDQVEAMVAAATERWGRVDILI